MTKRIAIVTGGAQGIGLGITSALTAKGYRVAVWDRDPQALSQLTAGTDTVLPQKVDVTKRDDVEAAVADLSQ